jgi:hypothetical protein
MLLLHRVNISSFWLANHQPFILQRAFTSHPFIHSPFTTEPIEKEQQTMSKVATGRAITRNLALAASMAKFDEFQLKKECLPLDSMNESDLEFEFPIQIARYCDHFIQIHPNSTRSSLETAIKTLFQAIREKFTVATLDEALHKACKKTYKEFQDTILSRFTGELSLQRDMGIRSSDVATCKVLPIVSKMEESEHRYAITVPMVRNNKKQMISTHPAFRIHRTKMVHILPTNAMM